MMNKKENKFFSEYIFYIVSVLTLGLTFYGLWFQTEGFTLEYVANRQVIISVAIGLVAGGLLMRYLVEMSKEKKVGTKKAKLSMKDLKTMIYGDILCFIIALVMQYSAGSVSFFLIATAFMVFTVTCIWFYVIWVLIIKKVKAKKNAD